MSGKQRTYRTSVELFERSLYPQQTVTPDNAWLGIYQVLLWYEPVNELGITALPHIIDADKLRMSAHRRASAQAPTAARAWQRKAQAIEQHIAQELGIKPQDVESVVDRLLKSPGYVGMQRHNPLGDGFIGLITHVLKKFGNPPIEYLNEVDATQLFPGIQLVGRSQNPRIDILATKGGSPRTIISAKWSFRHDRASDVTNECPVYKAAARQRGLMIDFYSVTNEFDAGRLTKLLTDPCSDGVVHVHKDNVITVCGMNGRLGGMLDLKDLVDKTYGW